tara:strand:+ start:1871 stop:2257 length:387 start_codon:yes stop_codon:yes gene_type:complete
MRGFRSFLDECMLKYEGDKGSDTNMYKFYQAWMFSKLIGKLFFKLPFDDSQIEIRNKLWSDYQLRKVRRQNTLPQKVRLSQLIATDTEFIYSIISKIKVEIEASGMEKDYYNTFRQLPDTLGSEVRDY